MRARESFRTWITVVAAAAWITGCTGDDASGETEDGSSGTGTGTTEVSGVPPTTNTPDDGADDGQDTGGTTIGSEADSGDSGGDTASGGTAADDTGSTGVGACDDPPALSILLPAEDAEVVDPMMAMSSMVLPDEMVFAASNVEEEGTVTFSFDLECDSEVIIQGLVWDRFAGFEPPNADSFYVTVDDEREELFPYGCQTQGQADSLWSWQPVVPFDGKMCGETPGVYALTAGAHTIQLRNREGGVDDNRAAVAALVVTDDANFDPTTLLDPYPM